MFIQLLIVILLFTIIYLYLYSQKKEHFNTRHGDYCNKCIDKTMGQCLECSNCGWFINDFESGCTHGDASGPYNMTAKKWYHNDPYYRSILSNDNDYVHYAGSPIFSK